MKTTFGTERCATFLNAQLGDTPTRSYADPAGSQPWFITISRQGGCNAHGIAARTAELLQAQEPDAVSPWTLFDRNLVEEVLKDHHLPARLRDHMPEDRRTELDDIMGELFDLHPSSWELVHRTSDTMLRLADRGHCLLIGRGANFVTRKLSHGFHVRLIGSLEGRVRRTVEHDHVSPEAARKTIRDQDRARARYAKKYFEADINDPEHYHLVINGDWFDAEQAAQAIAHALLQRLHPASPQKASA